MFDRARVDLDTPRCVGDDVDDALPEAMVVTADILADTLALRAHVQLVHAVARRMLELWDVGGDRGLLVREEELVDDVWVLAVCVSSVPEHAEHPANAAGAVDLDAGREGVGRGRWG